MNAHQQLASMLEYLAETGYAPATAVDFIRDHGSTLAMLMQAYVDRKDDAIAAALRKLTQDATP